jgi:hypothetical protein
VGHSAEGALGILANYQPRGQTTACYFALSPTQVIEWLSRSSRQSVRSPSTTIPSTGTATVVGTLG